MTRTLPSLVVILGPTAVGKTEISIQVAEKVDAEIISIDSRLIYRGMDIGTAKPTQEQRKRVPHHLIDVADPQEPWSLAVFQRAALDAINVVIKRERLPILVGGTGQYLTAIVEGWSPPPKAESDELRDGLIAFAETEGSEALHQRLAEIDPVSAARIDHRNIRRVARALEIFQVSGIPASEIRGKKPPPFRVLRVGLTLPRDELYNKIDARIDVMIAAGLVEEVKSLMARGLSAQDPAMSAIGYRQIIDHVTGKFSLEEAVRRIRRATRQFVRQQSNWFRADDPGIHWFEVGPNTVISVVKWIEGWRRGR
ncbi:MAG: tRNA (adenosine(37)-N6)-dimethylallyltransferase MiaA [Anaerolineales bacterium]|nr:tRNA (adenosine(37)-N6)-dimethylallyltransferase MiaA [Anaerolineales bacterium]